MKILIIYATYSTGTLTMAENAIQFLKDMGPAPMDRTWLGRLDVRGNYEPANCIWTTREEQENRRAFCRKVTLNGQEMTAAQASRLPGQPCRFTILYRQ